MFRATAARSLVLFSHSLLYILTYLVRFYIHLVDVLGPEEFLSIVCMLIVAKADKRLVRLRGRDLHAALALPLSLLQHYPPNVQLPVSASFKPIATLLGLIPLLS